MHWRPLDAHTALLGAATSTGSLALLRRRRDVPASTTASSTSPDRSFAPLEWIQTLQLDDLDSVLTSFAWLPTPPEGPGGALVSAASGEVVRLPPNLSDAQLRACEARHADGPLSFECAGDVQDIAEHAAEAWIVVSSTERAAGASDDSQNGASRTRTGVYSGGDDARLAYTPMVVHNGDDDGGAEEEEDDDADTAGPAAWQTTRLHDAGVTFVLPVPQKNVLLTGSYDDKLRVVAPPVPSSPDRTKRRPRELAGLDLGGGVWRLYVLDEQGEQREKGGRSESTDYALMLLACCMYAGARIVRVEHSQSLDEDGDGGSAAGSLDEGEWSIKVLGSFTEHESMCYGGAVLKAGGVDGGAGGETRALLATCSFYDRRLCLWHF